ncbi:MAG: T9SS type A sorting domain-containing protein [Crocinitomicaceae bacterium]|nr:T9SS type A sorting domain-containing protein [Crocinitomicaceae bacterium]
MKKIILSTAIALTAFVSNAQDITSGLVSKYTFDQDSIEDVIGNNNGTTLNGIYNFSGYGTGKAIGFNGFDGTDPQAIVNKGVIEDSIVAFDQDFTISFWFRLTDYNLNQPMIILSSRRTLTGSEAGGIEFAIRKDPFNTLQVAGRKITGGLLGLQYNIESGIISTNQWYFVCFTQIGALQTLYLNGNQIGQDLTNSFAEQSNLWALGSSRSPGENEREFNGSIDELRLYNRALSGQEVAQLYNFIPGTASIEENFSEQIKAYPNPTNNSFNLSTKDVLNVSIYDLSGTLVFQSTAKETYDISHLSSGSYILSAETANGLYQQKIIKR